MNKYRAKRTLFQGQWFDSKAEAGYAAQLELRRKAGEIIRWERGKTVVLVDGAKRSERITYKPDFHVWWTDGRYEVIDVKGALPRDFRLRRILWAKAFPDVPLRIVDRDGNDR